MYITKSQTSLVISRIRCVGRARHEDVLASVRHKRCVRALYVGDGESPAMVLSHQNIHPIAPILYCTLYKW